MKNNYTTPRIKYTQVLLSLFFILFLSFAGFSQGVDCASAENLTANVTSTPACDNSSTNLDNTQSNGAPSCMGTFYREGWWSFTITSGPLDITITAVNNEGTRLSLSVYSGTCAGTLTEEGCINENNGVNPTLTVNNLSNGTYYIRGQYNTGSGPATIGNICVSGNPACATPTVNAATNVGGTSADINWTAASPAPSNGYEYIVSTDNSTATPGDDITGTTTGTTANITGLSSTTTYYVFVRSDCGGGTYSAWDGPVTFTTSVAGNVPCDAISLTNNATCSFSVGTNVGTSGSGIPAPTGCSPTIGYSGSDVWFQTTASSNGTIEVTVDIITSGGGMSDPVLAIYNGTCGSLNLLDCDDDSGPGLEPTESVTGLTPGETIFIRVWDWNGTGDGTFNICANTLPDPPPNDLCANATTLPCGTIDMAGTNVSTTNVAHGTGCSMSNYGTWYTFVGDGDLSVLSVSPESGYDVEMAVVSGNCGAFTNLNCVDNSFSGGAETWSFITTNGVRYYVYVAHYLSGSTTTGDYTITRTCQTVTPPPNDDPCGAVDLVVNADCVVTAGTTLYATPTGTVANPSCSGYSGGDVWYTVTVPPNGQITIDTQAGVVTDNGMAIYSGTCGGTLTELACENDTGMTSISLTTADGILPGDILYIRVWETGNNNNGTFGICATSTVPAGTNGVIICLGNDSQPLTTDLFCNTGATSPFPLSGVLDTSDPQANRLITWIDSNDPCNFQSGALRYYDTIDFTVTATGTYVFDFNGTWDSMGYIVVNDGNFTPGSCASGTYIAGDDATGSGNAWPYYSQITATLTQGVNYTLITTHWPSSTSLGSYTWDVDVTPTSAEWYDAPTGGNLVGYGAFFDPIAAGEIADTNTAGTWSYYVACDATSTRTQADFTIIQGPQAVTGTGAATGCGAFEVTVDVNEPSGTQWVIRYDIVGDGSNTLYTAGLINSTPGTVTISEPVGTQIIIRAINTSTGCFAIAPTTITVTAGGKVWNGAVNTDWFNANNWSPTGVPDSSDCVVIPDTSSGSGNDPIITGTGNGDAASITVENGGILTLLPGGTVTVQDEVTVLGGGLFELQGSQQDTAQLIQVNNATNSGNITLVRETNVRTRDYVYWSSPVENFGVTSIAPTTPTTLIFEWIPTVGGNPGQHGEWSNTTETMIAGKGYIVRGPNGNGNTNDTATWNTITFNGVPHNGTITKGIARGGYGGAPINGGGGAQVTNEDDNWNLVGNPYPSSLDAVDFLTTNSNIEGTVYLWTHGTRIQQGAGSPFYGTYVYNYNISDYLEYNASGGTQSGFDGFIGSGQGFFVKMLNDTDTTPATSTVTFDNTMRDRTQRNDQFFRNANPIDYNNLERHRIWLDLVEPSGNTNTTLLAYVEGATMDKDRLFDAKTIGGNGKNLYTVLNEQPLIIQGRALPFDSSDQVALGINVAETGVFAIAIHDLDGLFDQTPQDIFINDTETGIVHNLKEAPYFFTLDQPGVYNNRFIVQYTNNALSIDEFENNTLSITAPESNYIKIKAGNQVIKNVIVYDLHGRILIEKQNVNQQEVIIQQVPQSTGTYLVKAILADGSQKVQKIILK